MELSARVLGRLLRRMWCDIVLAVFVGIGIAIVVFILRMSRSLIRRTYRGDTVPSRRARNTRQRAILAQHGRRIHVLELEGAIFFGTVERLADAIERAVADGARFLILDLGRVTDVDKGLYRDLPLCGLRSSVAHAQLHS